MSTSVFSLHRPTVLLGWLGAITLGVLIGFGQMSGALAVAAVLLIGLMFLKPEWFLVASILSIMVGQLIRIQLPNSDTTVIGNDVLLPMLLVAWLMERLASGRLSLPRSNIYIPGLLLVLVMIWSLFINRQARSADELLSGGLYILRWIEYAALFFVASQYITSAKRARWYLRLIIGTGVMLAVLGFAQLRLFPDFSFMAPQGWDPHVGRLLSTWFDPNFLGGYLVMLTTISLAMALAPTKMSWRGRGGWWAAVIIMTAAIVFTFSRSAYVAVVVGAGLVALVRSRTILIIGLLTFLSIVLFVPRVQERVIGIRSIDETARFRLVSWSNAYTVFQDHPWFGVGYNVYKFVQVEYLFLDRPTEHSASGSDSSVLTIAVTTGAVGLLVWVWLYGAVLREAWRTWRDKTLASSWQSLGLGFGAALIALLAHAQFVNGLFYPHIMEATWILLAIVIMIRQLPKST